jgi:peptidoglycan/xylan/chitin deacetylase (PgdA/CDA1 family)
MKPDALVPAVRALGARRSLILSYHGIGRSNASGDPGFLRVHPDAFRRQVELMLNAGFHFLTVADFAARAAGGPPPPGLSAVSFDDGMEDNHSVLLPLLQEYGIPATVYVASGMLGQPNPWVRGERMMTADEVRAMADAGVEVGAHSVTHPDMSTLGYDECLREMVESREALERMCGRPIRTFAYPFCTYGEAARRAARAAGFEAAVTCQGRGTWALDELKRTMITGKDGLTSFVAKLWDVYGPVFHSPPGRLARGATRGLRRRVRALRERHAGA